MGNNSVKLVVAGSRYLNDKTAKILYGILDDLLAYTKIDEVVCGEATGADFYGKTWAIKNNIPVKSFIAEWNIYGKAAGPIRNEEMAEYCTKGIVVLLKNRENKGSKNMIQQLKNRNKPVTVIEIEEK